MNTKILEYIIAIAQEHSVSRAAERFYLTQPVLSRHLKKIEDSMGTALFVRQKDGMALTEAGRIYINSAQNILHLESELEADLRAMLEEEKNTLRVYMDYPYEKQLSERILPGFRETYRHMQVRFLYAGTEKILSSFVSGGTGIGILISPGRRLSGLEYIAIYKDELVVVRPEGPESPDSIFMQPSGTSLRAAEDRWLEQEGAAFSMILEVQSLQAGLNGALAGQGCACVLRSMAEREKLGLLDGVPALPFEVCVVYPKNMVFRPAGHALLQEILHATEAYLR